MLNTCIVRKPNFTAVMGKMNIVLKDMACR